jgi:hypothetical protein
MRVPRFRIITLGFMVVIVSQALALVARDRNAAKREDALKAELRCRLYSTRSSLRPVSSPSVRAIYSRYVPYVGRGRALAHLSGGSESGTTPLGDVDGFDHYHHDRD